MFDMLQAVDSEGVILVLPDLKGASDDINHQKLLDLLEYSFGIKGCALRWFKLYLKYRTQTVQIDPSEPVTLKYGIPQGSVLGPILFIMHATPLGLDVCLYAGDTQLYITV